MKVLDSGAQKQAVRFMEGKCITLRPTAINLGCEFDVEG
jgi:hypothetical protein